MPQPIAALPTESPTMPLPPHRHAPSSSAAYPPEAGPRLSLPDVPQEDPPSYDDAVRNEIHFTIPGAAHSSRDADFRQSVATRASSARTRSERVGATTEFDAPSAPVASPDDDALRITQSDFTPTMVCVARSAPYPPVAPPTACDSTPYPPVGPPTACGSTPYPPVAPPTACDSTQSTMVGVGGSAPYPPVAQPPACDSIGFAVSNDPSLVQGMPMPTMSRNLPYPSQNPLGTSATPYPSMPLPPSHVYSPKQHSVPSTGSSTSYSSMPMPMVAPYPTDRMSKWDSIREAVRLPSSGLYPPERSPPRVDPPVIPMTMPMPNLRVDRRSSGDGARNVVPYPTDVPLQTCGAIGFAVLENSDANNGDSLAQSRKPNT